LRRPDPKAVAEQLDALKAKGISSIAIAFVHSYMWGEHEDFVARIAEEKGFAVSVSSQLQPMVSGYRLPHSPLISWQALTIRSSWSHARTLQSPTHTSPL